MLLGLMYSVNSRYYTLSTISAQKKMRLLVFALNGI